MINRNVSKEVGVVAIPVYISVILPAGLRFSYKIKPYFFEKSS